MSTHASLASSVAAPWRRLAASALDSAVSGLPLLALTRRRPGSLEAHRITAAVGPLAVDAVYTIAATTLFGRTFGQRLMGLRIVDRGSGGRPRWSRVAIRWAIAAAGHIIGNVVSPVPPSRLSELAKLEPEVKRLRRQHRGDRRRLNDALMSLYRQHGVEPLAALRPFVLRVVPTVVYGCVVFGPALRGPLHQGLHDRAANTVVVSG